MGDPDTGDTPAGRWRGLRDHPVIRVGGAYCLVAWILMQAGEIILPSFEAPAWIMQALIAGLVAGLPVVLILARLTRLPVLVGLADAPPTPIAFSRSPDPAREVGDILRLKSASLEMPMELSESRQVSTLICSLVGLRDGREDPEALLGFLAGLEEGIAQAVARYEGVRLPSGRDEIVVAFGFPSAHEDDARRAAKLALDLLKLVRAHDVEDGPETDIVCRAGLHSATIIIEEGASESDAVAVLGDTVGVAAFLLASAPEGGVALSASSQFLLRSTFLLEEIARQSHPRLGRDAPVFQLGRELSGEQANVMAEQSDVIGREHERSLLVQQWRTVLEGESEYVLIKGEPGVGKTSLMYQTLKELVADGEVQLLLLTCEPYYRDTPFRPLTGFIERNVFGGRQLDAEQRQEALRSFVGGVIDGGDEEAVLLLSALMSGDPEDAAAVMGASGKRVREKTLALLVSLIERFSARRPLIVAVEDLHWADPSTRDLIERLLAYDPSTPILGLFTARPEFEPAWANLPDVIEINLNKLPNRVAEELVRRQAGEQVLPPALVQQIVDNAGGIPLYLEQLTRSVLESREMAGAEGEGQLDIPPSLKASLAARIDHLGASKPLLQLASVIGFEFSYELLRVVCEGSDEKLLRKVLGTIVNAGLLYQKGAYPETTFKFKHRLIMEVASQSLLRRTRQRLHQVIADKLESHFAERCENRPTQVAHHLSRAGNAPKAIAYWIKAAQLSQAKFANEEAIAQVQRGLAALKDVADEELRNQYEIILQNLVGMIQLSSRGYTNPEVRVAYERALELSDKVEQTPDLFRMIVGLWMYYLIRGEYDRAIELSDQLLQLASRIQEPPEHLQANYCAGYAHYLRGEIDSALVCFRRALSFADEDADYARQTPSRDDTRIHLHCMYAMTLWSAGDPVAARQSLEGAQEMARRQGQPYGQVWALFFATLLEHMRGDIDGAATRAREMVDICESKGFSFFVPLGLFFQACAIGDPARRLEAMLDSHRITMSTGARAHSSYLRAVIIRELVSQGELQRARDMARENEVYIENQGERVYSSENRRLQAILVCELDRRPDECPGLLEQAVEQAREVRNLPLALSCALCLYRQPGSEPRALALIEAVVADYTSDDDTDEFREAITLLDSTAARGLSA